MVPTKFSKLVFLAVSWRYDLSKWPHESILFLLYLQENEEDDEKKIHS